MKLKLLNEIIFVLFKFELSNYLKEKNALEK